MAHPFASMGATLIRHLGAVGAVTLSRYGAGTHNQVTGDFDEGTPVDSALNAVVNPLSARQSSYLSKGEITEEGIQLFTVADLRTAATGAQADEVTWQGDRYRVRWVESFAVQAVVSQAIAVRIGADP